MVEATRVELVSENHLPQLSPGAGCLLRFPSSSADRQALDYGSYPVMTEAAASLRSRSPLQTRPDTDPRYYRARRPLN